MKDKELAETLKKIMQKINKEKTKEDKIILVFSIIYYILVNSNLPLHDLIGTLENIKMKIAIDFYVPRTPVLAIPVEQKPEKAPL